MKKLTVFLFVSFIAIAVQAQQPTYFCNVLEAITKNEAAFPWINKQQKITLVDTFKLFTPDCSGTYGGRQIEVVNKMPKAARVEAELFCVSNINTSKSEGLIISIIQLATKHIVGYSISFAKRDIIISKTSVGDL